MASSKLNPMSGSGNDNAAGAADTVPAVELKSEDALEEVGSPRQDGGTGAWLFMVGAAIIEIVAWGEVILACSLQTLLTLA